MCVNYRLYTFQIRPYKTKGNKWQTVEPIKLIILGRLWLFEERYYRFGIFVVSHDVEALTCILHGVKKPLYINIENKYLR